MPVPTKPPKASSAFAEVEFELLRDDFLAKFERVHARLNLLEAKIERLAKNGDVSESARMGDGGTNTCGITIGDVAREGHEAERNELTLPNDQSEERTEGTAISVIGGSLGQTIGAKTDLTGITCSLASVAEDPEDQLGLVSFSESAWTYPVVIGLVRAGVVEAVFAVLLLLLNLFMQMAFMIVILTPDFLPGDITEQIVFAKQWRRSVAHDHQNLDLASTSLASRVCNGDGALIVSTRQATLLENIDSYMGLAIDAFEPDFFQPGVLLSVLCILLWSLCVYKELRSILHAFEAVRLLPRSARTILDGNVLQSLSFGRYKMLKATYLLRTAIAVSLLISGIRWLAQTTSITELMLNAVALNAILDVDEFLFAGFTPMSIHLAIQRLEPMQMKYTARRNKIESFFLFFVLLVTFLVPYLVLLRPQADAMLSVKQELCFGNQTFVVGQNQQSQVIFGLVTEDIPEGGRQNSALSPIERAVDIHKFADPHEEAYYIGFVQSRNAFEIERTRSMASEAAEFNLCLEQAYLTEGGEWYQDAAVGALTMFRLRTAAAVLGRFDHITNCQQVADLCNLPEARLLRMVCGVTCECSNPFASGWYKVLYHGCSEGCLEMARQRLASEDCKDRPMDDTWIQMWDDYLPTLAHVLGSGIYQSSAIPYLEALVAAMKLGGCATLKQPQFRNLIGTQTSWCEGDPELVRPLAWTCPESCDCTAANGTSLPSYCPRSCAA
ncbi:Vacuolar protein sorting-associated protein 11-like [Durusdinium trenchii]|uniref:Vacuolar protein sorting-associated protein 11-like n=1 Tax=Durusdinium trenchii TaxID=1381693 RepID=A0ABP0KEI1_9DINO